MKKKWIYVMIGMIVVFIGTFFGIKGYQYLRIKNAKIEITFVDNLTIEFLEKKKVSDFIVNINGNIVDDFEISFNELGKKKYNLYLY